MVFSKAGLDVVTAIFQNGCQIQYPRIVINTEQQQLWYAYVCFMEFGFQICTFLTPTFIPATFVDGGRQYNCHLIAKSTPSRAMMLTLLVASWIAISKVVYLTINNIKIHASFKVAF